MKKFLIFLKKRKWWVIGFFIFIGLGFLVYNLKQSNALVSNGEEKQTYIVKPVSLKSTVSLSGNVEADEQVSLQFQTSGKLAWIGVKEGDYVEQWQTIATLDQRDLRKQLDKKLNDFMISRWDYDQLKDDYKSQETDSWNKYLTDEITRIVEQSQFGLNKAIIDVELADLTLELSYLVTPIAGIVTQIDHPIAGVNITPATSRFEVVNPATLYLKTIVDQQDIVKLRKNQRAQIIFDSFPDKTYYGSVYYQAFAPEEGEESSYVVKVSIPSSLVNRLRLGMGAEIIITTAKKTNVLAIPFAAVAQEGKKNYVVILENNKPKQRQVITGIESNDLIEIKSGVKEGDVLVY